MAGRDFVTPDDVRSIAVPVLAHRIVMRPEYEIEGIVAADSVKNALDAVPVPR